MKSNVVPLISEKRFCVECRHYHNLTKSSLFAFPFPDVCGNPANGREDPVKGQMMVTLPYGREAGHACGPTGKLFERKLEGWLSRLVKRVSRS